MQARPTKGALAGLLAVGLLAGCGASPGSGAGSAIRLPHDGWRIYRVALNPSGTEVAIFGDPPGGTATWGVGTEAMTGGGVRRVGPTDQFLSDALWADDRTLVVTVGTVDRQQLALLGASDGRLRVISTGQPFTHDYTDGMAVSPDGRQLAITLTERTTEKAPSTEIVLMDLSSGVAQDIVPMSERRPRMPAWASPGKLLYVDDSAGGPTLEAMDLSSRQSMSINTRGYRLSDIAADDGSVAFDGLDPGGSQGLFVSRLDPFAPSVVEQGSFSMPAVRAAANLVAAVATGRSSADAGDVVVDRVTIGSRSSPP